VSPTPAQWVALLARVEALEAAQQQSEPIDEKENARRFRACMAAIDAATPEQIRAVTSEAAPVATDDELRDLSSREVWTVDARRAIYNLGRQHGAANSSAGLTNPNHPAKPDSSPAPAAALSDALTKAECALADIAEGEPNTDEGDSLEWAERRCAEALAIIRPVMQQHKIRTSEWLPAAQPIPPAKPQPHGGRLIRGDVDPGPSAAPAPAGGLVERVAERIVESMVTSDQEAARAAILDVAEWLQEGAGKHGRWLTPANDLRDEVRRG